MRAIVLAAACAAAIGLSACGGGDDSSSTTTTTTTPAGATGAASTDTTGTGADASSIRDQFNQQLLQVLTTSEGLTDSQAQCALNELESSISDQDIQNAVAAAAQGGSPPQSLLDAAFAAGQKCAGQ